MNEPVEIFLGFDPGGRDGRGRFGWSICRAEAEQIQVCAAGRARYAGSVVESVVDALPVNPRILAIGIDAPMFWNITGEDRVVDAIIENAGVRPIPVNSLRGACLVQGILLGASLYQRYKAPITEVYPRALTVLDPAMLDRIVGLPINEHERDATYAAYAAWCMHRQAPGWRDLFPEEPDPVLPLGTPVSYWMPIPQQPPG